MTIPADHAPARPTFLPAEYESGSPEDTPIPDVPNAGESFRKAYFDLQPGSVAVATNQPAHSLLRHGARASRAGHFRRALRPQRRRVPLQDVGKPTGGPAIRDQWMGWLRQQAGLDRDWVPPDEAKGKTSSDDTDDG